MHDGGEGGELDDDWSRLVGDGRSSRQAERMHDGGEGGELDDGNVSGQRSAVVLITSSRSIVSDSLPARKTSLTSVAWAEINTPWEWGEPLCC